MSTREIFGNQPPGYCLPANIGNPNEVLAAQAPSSGPNILTWGPPPTGGQSLKIGGGVFDLYPGGDGGGTGSIQAKFDLYKDGPVITVIVLEFDGTVSFTSLGGNLSTNNQPFAGYAPAGKFAGTMAGAGGTVPDTTSVMGWSVNSSGDFKVYPMSTVAATTIRLAPATLIWEIAPAPP